MSIWENIKEKPDEDLYFEFRKLFDMMEERRIQRQLKRRWGGFDVPVEWWEKEWKEMRKN